MYIRDIVMGFFVSAYVPLKDKGEKCFIVVTQAFLIYKAKGC